MAIVAGSSSNEFTLQFIEARDTARLIPSRYDEPPIFEPITLGDHALLDAANELDSATNPRFMQSRPCAHIPGFLLPDNALLQSHIVNGAFIHGHAQGRLSHPDCGTWYASGTTKTAQIEVGHHKLLEFADLAGNVLEHFPQQIKYTCWNASYIAQLHVVDSKVGIAAGILDPMSYLASQRRAAELRSAGSLGIKYPSVRDPAGTNFAIFMPSVVQGVSVGGHWVAQFETHDQPPRWIAVDDAEAD